MSQMRQTYFVLGVCILIRNRAWLTQTPPKVMDTVVRGQHHSAAHSDERSRPLLLANRVAALCHALQQLREHLAGFMAFIRDLDIPLADESRARLSVRAGGMGMAGCCEPGWGGGGRGL